MNRCEKIKNCPASQYLNCEAWLQGMDCWGVSSPRCSADMRLCLQHGCPVYEKYSVEVEAMLKTRAMETSRTSRNDEEASV